MKNKRFLPWTWISYFVRFCVEVFKFISKQIYESLRLQLILTIVFCFIASLTVVSVSGSFFRELNRTPWIDYSSSIRQIDSAAQSILYSIRNEIEDRQYDSHEGAVEPGDAVPRPTAEPSEEEKIRRLIAEESGYYRYVKILILDLDGNVLYKSDNATETEVDLHSIIRNAMTARLEDFSNSPPREYYSFYPINLEREKAYLVVSGMPHPEIDYYYTETPMPYLLGLIVFIILFFLLTKRKIKYIKELAGALLEISKGNFDYRATKHSEDELGTLASSINHMANQLQIMKAEERKADKIKNELITNVSHDLRTPLTLIMGYLRLLKDKNYDNEQQGDNYLNIAYSKSEKLKVLIEDLFEYTKLSNEGVKLAKEKVCINELLEQLMEELISYAEENDLIMKRVFTNEKLMVSVDPDKITRVFENLITNAVKYSHKPGQIKVLLYKEGQAANICFINKADPMSEEDLNLVFERFYRLDQSRSSETGGSGLGLAIAKSIVEYHNGQIWAESDEDEVRFWVKLQLA